MTDTTADAAVPSYTPVARLLHWTVAALVLFMIPLGIVIANEWGGPAQQFLYNLHKSIGATLIPIVIIRLLYRITHPAPPLPSDLLPIQRFAAHATHWALYVLILVQPLVGYIMTSAYPAPVPFFGLFNLPSIWPQDRALSDQLKVVHLYIGIAIVVVAAIHIGAALHHHFVRKDGILMRMISS